MGESSAVNTYCTALLHTALLHRTIPRDTRDWVVHGRLPVESDWLIGRELWVLPPPLLSPKPQHIQAFVQQNLIAISQ